MIRIKLKEIAEKLGKTILEIAAETGLNRNTVTSLYHNKVDGIKFETVEKICSTYGLALDDVIELGKENEKSDIPAFPYRQEGDCVPFTIWTPFMGIDSGLGKMFHKHVVLFLKNGYGWFYWDRKEMDEWARRVYARYSGKHDLAELYEEYLKVAGEIEKFYLNWQTENLRLLENNELVSVVKKLLPFYDAFWGTSEFIDAFDAGFDQEEINKISKRYGLKVEDVVALTTPNELTIDRERKLTLIGLAKGLSKKNLSGKELLKMVKGYVSSSQEIKEYVKRFDYFQSNYGFYRPIKNEDIVSELVKYLSAPGLIKKELDELSAYEQAVNSNARAVMRKYGLKSNPLEFFRKITFWRESRKKFNLMGIVFLFRVLGEVERRTGIPVSCLGCIIPDELDAVLKGVITRPILESRKKEGVTYIREKGCEYKVLYGKEAESLRDEFDRKIAGEGKESMIVGQVASQGFAKGLVCVVRTINDFVKFKDGQILVTGMTRPEFVPLMKKAAGIVTNEGGITSHAAIVSRELNKPCIIGTKNATEFLHDGDLVEVRAMHGTVRVLERA